MAPSVWQPDQYNRFRDERRQPYFDLLALVKPKSGLRVVDLGCGTGELTRELHRTLDARETLGMDSSETMLSRSKPFAGDGLTFSLGEIEGFTSSDGWDVIFSNAAIQWVPRHAQVFSRLTAALREGGQLAVQMPANHDHPSHTVAVEIAGEEPFRTALQGFHRESPVLAPESYAALLHELGYKEQHVRLQVYPHVLASSAEVVEWVKGTLLTAYRERLSTELYEQFLARYRERLIAVLGDPKPYFYGFKRLLLWAQR